jgi:hypothetical protein
MLNKGGGNGLLVCIKDDHLLGITKYGFFFSITVIVNSYFMGYRRSCEQRISVYQYGFYYIFRYITFGREWHMLSCYETYSNPAISREGEQAYVCLLNTQASPVGARWIANAPNK